MSILLEKLNSKEKQKLENMFMGDKSRDASEKIRGFLFQDLVALNYLLDTKTEYVCLEFLEDVDVFYDDGTLEFIQVKYYPKSNPDMKEIMTDLYYQYLRADILKLDLKSKLRLIIHGKDEIKIPDLDEMKKYINCDQVKRTALLEEPGEWLSKEVYVLTRKDEQKKKLFEKSASDESILDFLLQFKKIIAKDIVNYQEDVANKLENEFSDTYTIEEEENRKKILLGLAIGYVQRRYILNNPNFDNLKIVKAEFLEYIQQTINVKTEEHIVGYLTSVVGEQYISIITNNPEMSNEDIMLLNHIASNTQIWLSDLTATKEGQCKLLNTISYKNINNIKGFIQLNISSRAIKIAECSDNLQMFLNFLWKIMMNLCRSKKDFHVEENIDMLNPRSYIDDSVDSYICLKFEQDFVDSGVILPAVRRAKRNEDYRNICSRMYLEKPQKWYMSGYECGKKEYKYSAAIMKDDENVVDVDDDSYFIECLDCIKVDEKQWDVFEDCSKCIFLKTCIKGKEY